MSQGAVLGTARSIIRGNLVIPFLIIIDAWHDDPSASTLMLDVLFTFNIAPSVVVLLVCIYAERPMDFAAFPTVILVATLLRLALNVASTRIVLINGHEGGDAAGKVIQAFGEVLIGGNYAVPVSSFCHSDIINFRWSPKVLAACQR